MIQRVRSRLVGLALLVSFVTGIAGADAMRTRALSDVLPVAVAAFAITIGIGWVVVEMLRGALHGMLRSMRDVVRDPSRRIAAEAAPGDELRELAEWINFLAEDADRSHRALARERMLLAAVAEGLTQGVIAVDSEHRIELLNDAARKMLGVTSSPVGELLIDFVRVPELFDLIDSDVAATAEVQLPNTPRALIRTARKWGGDGRVLLLEDVTTVRRLETVRRDFVANVSHELRTPVAVIRANAETLMAGAKDDPVIAGKLIDGLHRNAERLARILADLLDLSRLDAGQYRLELSSVPVRPVIEQSLSAVEPQAAQRNVTVRVDIPTELAVRADPKALDHILVNLIDNGVKYGRPDGNVWVEARATGPGLGDVRIEVRDDGPGIADKHRTRVFERFYRADPSRSREAGGTGLGLSIVKHLVESMGGEVGVEPHLPQGSIFWLRLPRASSIGTPP
ncbi:MAG: PAS domain-containing protein [Deltaproteobacteria bacterium]|nr:MAG: PAS domain-containing protein [Deltaproteobacteria bacterium]